MSRDYDADMDYFLAHADLPGPTTELCEETPVEGGAHVRSLVSDRCIFCKREIE